MHALFAISDLLYIFQCQVLRKIEWKIKLLTKSFCNSINYSFLAMDRKEQ